MFARKPLLESSAVVDGRKQESYLTRRDLSPDSTLFSPPFFLRSCLRTYYFRFAMSLPPSTANWHWKNKNVTRWAREWFERELTVITVSGDAEGESVSISGVTEVDGDVELGQRKSKCVSGSHHAITPRRVR